MVLNMKSDKIFYCIQCQDRLSGKIGSFVYKEEKKFHAISPVFTSLAGLFSWMKTHGFKVKEFDERGNFVPYEVASVYN